MTIKYSINGGALLSRVISDTPTTEHQGTLYGIPALASVAYTLIAGSGADEIRCDGLVTTGNLPPELPGVTISKYDPDAVSDERYFVGVIMEEQGSYPVIFNRRGDLVWYFQSEDLAFVPQVEVATDGRGLLIGSFAFDRTQDEGMLSRVSLGGEVLETTRMVGGHHFFEQTSAETIAHASIDVRDWGVEDQTRPVVGDALMEVTGDETTEIFNAWDWSQPTGQDSFGTGFYPQGEDWTHLNSIFFDPATSRYLLSFPHLRTVLEVERESGDVVTTFSPDTYDFQEHFFKDTHDVRLLEGEILTSINLTEPITVVEYQLHRDTRVLEPIWVHEGDYRVTFMGQFSRLANGNRLINYGSTGVLQEVTPDGEVVWEVQTELGTWLGNGQMLDHIHEADQP